jgi:hypothetical protein
MRRITSFFIIISFIVFLCFVDYASATTAWREALNAANNELGWEAYPESVVINGHDLRINENLAGLNPGFSFDDSESRALFVYGTPEQGDAWFVSQGLVTGSEGNLVSYPTSK